MWTIKQDQQVLRRIKAEVSDKVLGTSQSPGRVCDASGNRRKAMKEDVCTCTLLSQYAIVKLPNISVSDNDLLVVGKLELIPGLLIDGEHFHAFRELTAILRVVLHPESP